MTLRLQDRMLDPSLDISRIEATVYKDHLHAVKWEWVDGQVKRIAVGKCFPLPEQDVYAEELCRFLNKLIAHDGRWRVVWTQPRVSKYDPQSGIFKVHVPELLECQYLDHKDLTLGDVQCVMDMEEDVEALMTNFSFVDVVNLCEEAYANWKAVMTDVDVKTYQKISPVQGEAPKDPTATPEDLI